MPKKGYRQTPEHRAKIAASRQPDGPSMFVCPFCGVSKEMNPSKILKNRTCGADDCRARYLNEQGHGNRGRARSPEARAKNSGTARGRPQSPEHVKARTASRMNRGRWFDVPDIGQRISDGYARGRAAGRTYGQIGTKNPMWRGGVANIDSRDRNSAEYGIWRLAVLRRDGYRCQMCGSGEYVIAHHVLSWNSFPRYRTDADNGIALCRSCHAKAHGFAQHFHNG